MTDHVLLACKGIMVTNVFHLQQTGRGMYESDDGDGTFIHLPPAFFYHPHFPACIGSVGVVLGKVAILLVFLHRLNATMPACRQIKFISYWNDVIIMSEILRWTMEQGTTK